MKRLVFIFIVLLVSLGMHGQTYTVTVDGYIGSGPSSCGTNNNGLKWIKLDFANGSTIDLFRQDGGQFRNQPYNFSKTFDVSNPLVRVRFRTVSRRNSLTGCRSSQVAEKTVNVTSPCFNQDYENGDIYHNDISGRGATISIVPNMNLTFNDGSPVTSIYSGCEGDTIDIDASAGFMPANDIYRWEFNDPVNTVTQNHPTYQALLDAVTRTQENFFSCLGSGDFDRCDFLLILWENAQQALADYTGPETIQAPVWRPIPNKDGQSNIGLKLSDLYADIADQKSAVNKNIDVRISPFCNVFDGRTNMLTIQYLPKPPEIPKDPEVADLECSYSSTAGFTIFFDRQINDFEAVDISLLRKLESDPTYVPFDDNTNITSFAALDAITWTHTWNPTPGKEIKAGEYEIRVTGYERGGSSAIPFCEMYTYFFTVTAPEPVKFNAIKNQDETCFDKNDGVIEITASGGSESYVYQIKEGTAIARSGTFTLAQSPFQIKDLAPGTYVVDVTDSKNCEDRVNVQNPIEIKEIDQITHVLPSGNAITPPGAPGMSDASILVQSISGGTPLVNSSTTNYYNYEVFINGSTVNTISGQISNGGTITGLPAGNHQIEYTDKNLCTQVIDLPTISDPQPITFNIEKEDPKCSDGDDGVLTITNLIGGYPPYGITWKRDGIPVPEPPENPISITGGDVIYEVVITDERSGRAEQKNIRFDNVPLPITITEINIPPIKCFGDQATVTITAAGGSSGEYQYALWTGLSTVWQDSNTFMLNANPTIGYRFRVRDRSVISCVSDISDPERIDQPSEISIVVKPENITSNNIFGDNKGAITLDVSGGTLNSMTPEYNVAWRRNGNLISNTGVSISGLFAGTYIATVKDANGCTKALADIIITQPDELLVSIQETTPILCFGGTGTLTALPVGGLGDYKYQWYKDGNPITDQVAKTISNIQKGNYTVRVDDEYTFKESAPKIFGEPDQLSLSLVGEDVSCFNGNDGKIILNPEGGIAPYSYSIDNKVTYIPVDDLTNLTIEGLVAGSYSVWLRDDNGCETLMAETIPITVPDEIMIEETSLEHVTVMGGSDGSISISVTGGTPRTTNPNYSITWEKDGAPITNAGTTISNLSFGSYTVFVTDKNGCGNDRTFEVKQPLPLEVRISETSPILCHDDELGELLATVTGGYPIDSSPSDFEYRWYRIDNSIETPINTDVTLDRLQNLPAGTYKVVVNDSKGTSTNKTFDLLEPDDLLVSLANTPVDVKCYGEPTGAIDITIVGGPKDEITGEYLPYTFSWTKVGDPDFKATTEDLQNITAGTYEVVVIDDNLCTTSLSEAVIIDQPDAVLEIYDVKPINLSGFQTQDGSISLEVKGGTPPYRYSWTDIDDPNYTADSQDIKDLSIGTYELVITDANDCTTSITELITEPNQLTVSIAPLADDKGVQCFGGQTLLPLLATTQGGIGSYTYEWYEESDLTTIIFTTSETTEVEAGTYVVVVTDENGNKDDDTYEVTQPDMLDISENITHLLCRGDDNGRIDITVSGGVPPYKYSWGTGETTEDLPSLRAGKYTITITDANDCMLQKEIEVEQPQGLFVNGAISRIYPSSNGATDGSITVNIGGGTPPYTYEWRDFSNVLQASTTNVLDAIGAEKYSLTVIDANDCILVIEDVDVFEPPILEVFVEQVNVVTCNGVSSASLRAIVTGGVPYNDAKQYNYQWFDANTNSAIGGDRFLIENIGAGTYYVIVSDALDTSITSEVFTVGEPDTLESEMRTDFVNCGDRNDWTIIPQITGGTAPYTFLWNTGDTENALENVSAGSYSVTITDVRGCFVMDQVTVAPPEALITLEELTIPTCFKGCDGAIVLETIGGTPPYSYEWSNGTAKKDLIDICADTYSVMITDAKGCMITKEFILDNPSEFSIDLGEDITLCQDQTAVLNATIEDPNATYLWTTSDGFSSTSATIDVRDSNIYEVLVIDSKGCEARGDIFVDTITDAISAHFIASSQVFTGEEFVIVDNSDPVPESIDWIFPEEATVLYEDEHYAELIFDKPGEYEVTLQTSIGLCSALITKTIIVLDKEIEEEPGAGEGTIDIETLFEYKVYPNPTLDGQFTVDVNLKKVQPISLKIFNIIDNKLLDSRNGKDKDTYTFEYDMSSLPSGVYFILLETPSASQVRKLVKE